MRGGRRVFVELFAGTEGLSAALRRAGFGVVGIDILAGPEFDLNRDAVFQEVKGWVLAGLVWGVFAGTPCETFSRARRAPAHSAFPGPLRASAHPRGLPALTGREAQRVRSANVLADRAAILLRIATERGLVAGEENPASSILWMTQQRSRQESDCRYQDCVVDHCAYGTSYRARTRFRLANCQHSPALFKARCTGHGICSYTQRPHLWLSGATSQGFRTKVKAAYPRQLCVVLATIFSTSMENAMTAKRWEVFKK